MIHQQISRGLHFLFFWVRLSDKTKPFLWNTIGIQRDMFGELTMVCLKMGDGQTCNLNEENISI